MFDLHIKKARKKIRMTQKELAEKSRLSQSYISQLESPLRTITPTLQTIEVIAESLKICPYILISYDCNKCRIVRAKETCNVNKCKENSIMQMLEIRKDIDAKEISEYFLKSK